MKNYNQVSGSSFTWAFLNGLVAWRFWKNRNLFVFQGVAWSLGETIKLSNCWAKHYVDTQGWDTARDSNGMTEQSVEGIVGQIGLSF